MRGAVASTRRATVVDAILLGLGAVMATVAAIVLVTQYRPVLFRHDTSFIGSSLALLAPFGVIAGWRAGRRAARRGASARRVALRYGATVGALAALSAAVAVLSYRLRDGIGWPRLHLGVVIVAAGASTAMAAWFGGLAQRWPRPIGWTASSALGLCALVGQAVLALGLTNEFADRVADQCVERRDVRYCHFEGYRPFVDEWAPVVEAVLAAAPPPATRLTVRQTVEGVRPAAAGVAPKLEWSPGDTAPYALALDTANWVTGAVPVLEIASPPRFDLQEFEGRGMVVLWLAAQANARTCAAFRFSDTHPSGGEAVAGNEYVDVPVPGDREQRVYAAALLDDPDARRKVAANWARLVDPATTLEQAAQLLHIEPAADHRGLCN